MIKTAAELIAIFVECFIVTRMLIKYFQLKSSDYKLLKWAILFVSLLAADILGSFCIVNEAFSIFTCLACEILFAIVFLNGNIFEKLMISITNYALLYFINLPVLTLISAVSDMSTSELVTSHNIERIVCLFITKMLQFFATEFILWIQKKEEFHFKFNEWIIVIAAFIVTLLIGFSMHMITIGDTIKDYVYIAVALLLSILDIIIFVFMRKMNIINRQEKEQELLNLQLKHQHDKLHSLERKYQEISILKHDFGNGIDCICGMINQGDYTGALTYAEKLKERKINSIQTHIHSSSTVINAMINSKCNEANEYNIETSVRIATSIPEYLEFDLSVLLSNLLDNAIEACQKNKNHSQIILTIYEEAGYYRIVVRNTIESSVLQENKILESEKQDKLAHGWGLKSVEDIVLKHDGLIDFYEKDSMFFVDVLLTKKQEFAFGAQNPAFGAQSIDF